MQETGELIVIASVMRRTGTTGVQTHVRAFAEHLEQSGQTCVIVTPFDAPKWMSHPLVALRLLLQKVSPPAAVWLYRHGHALLLRTALRPLLGRHSHCRVYAQCPVSAQAALQVRRSPSQAVSMVVHFNVSQAHEWAEKGAISSAGRLYAAIVAFERRLLPRLDALIFVSRFMQDQVLQRVPEAARVRSAVIPNFVIDPGPSSPVEGAANDLITIGTLEPRKNQAFALQILAEALKRGRRLGLTVVGGGPDRARLVALAKSLGVESQVRFAGFVSGAAGLIDGHRACLHVATMENLSVALIEALARGRPLLACPTGGTAELFREDREGRALPLGQAAEAARIVCEAFDDPAVLPRLGRGARDRFLEVYEAGAVAERLRRFILEDKATAVAITPTADEHAG